MQEFKSIALYEILYRCLKGLFYRNRVTGHAKDTERLIEYNEHIQRNKLK